VLRLCHLQRQGTPGALPTASSGMHHLPYYQSNEESQEGIETVEANKKKGSNDERQKFMSGPGIRIRDVDG
jgi:hypothetical protein